MIEMLIVAAVWTVVVKRGVEDILHTARGGTPHRYAAAKARRSTGAAGRYWSTLWNDTFDDMLQRHNKKRTRRDAAPAAGEKPRGPMRSVLADFGRDVSRWGRATWRHGWESAGRRQQARRLRPRPGQDTVPGTVVPNRPQDETEDRPRDEDRPDPTSDPTSVPAEDGTDLQDEHPDPTQDEDGPDLQSVPDSGPDSGPDQDISPTAPPTTQEGSTMTTIPTGEVTSLSQTIRFCEDSAQAYRAQAHAIEQTQATLDAQDVSGPAAAAFATAMEQSFSAADAMSAAAAEFKKHLIVAEAYDAAQGAGTKAFVVGAR